MCNFSENRNIIQQIEPIDIGFCPICMSFLKLRYQTLIACMSTNNRYSGKRLFLFSKTYPHINCNSSVFNNPL